VRATEISQRSTEKADQEDPQRTYCTFSKGLLLTYHDILWENEQQSAKLAVQHRRLQFRGRSQRGKHEAYMTTSVHISIS